MIEDNKIVIDLTDDSKHYLKKRRRRKKSIYSKRKKIPKKQDAFHKSLSKVFDEPYSKSLIKKIHLEVPWIKPPPFDWFLPLERPNTFEHIRLKKASIEKMN